MKILRDESWRVCLCFPVAVGRPSQDQLHTYNPCRRSTDAERGAATGCGATPQRSIAVFIAGGANRLLRFRTTTWVRLLEHRTFERIEVRAIGTVCGNVQSCWRIFPVPWRLWI